MGLGLKRAFGLGLAVTLACAEPQPRYAAYGAGFLATDPLVSEVLCDTSWTNQLIVKNQLLKNAFAAIREPMPLPQTDLVNTLNHSILDKVLGSVTSEDDIERIVRAYTWDTTSVIHSFGKLLSLPPPEYTLSTDPREVLEYVLTQVGPTKNDSIPAAALMLSGFPNAVTRVRSEKDTLRSTIAINPFFISQALAVARHEQIHVWQFTPGSPLNIANNPYDEYFVEGVATYLNERLKYSFVRDSVLDARIRDHFARSTIQQIRSGDDLHLIIKYHLLPALIAQDAISQGPVQAVIRAGKPALCMEK